MTNQEKVSTAVHKIFPIADIRSCEKFSKGLSSSVYKVEVHNPDKSLAVKFFSKKIESRVEKSVQISNYLKENSLPSPQTYDLVKTDGEGWVVMECMPGHVSSEVWETASNKNQSIILVHSGAILKKIHDLKIPPFWIHQKHEVTSQKEWIEWTKVRILKYLVFAQDSLNKNVADFLETQFSRLEELYDAHSNFRFVPLHWDYHLSNINIDENMEISGIFDFDNAMKGHDMADLGQTVYWLIIQQKISEREMFEKLFTGYGKLTLPDREFVYLHFLLFLVGVMRSTWMKDDLKWLNEIHVEVLKNCVLGKYILN